MATTVFDVRDGRAFWSGQRLGAWATSLAQDLVDEFSPNEVWLFGSVARGDDDRDSDLDVLVVLDRYESRDALELKRRAIRAVKTPVPFDVAFSDVDRMATRARISGTLERAVMTEGRCLYRHA